MFKTQEWMSGQGYLVIVWAQPVVYSSAFLTLVLKHKKQSNDQLLKLDKENIPQYPNP